MLRTRGLSIKNLDDEKRELIRRFINRLHHERGISLGDIAKIIGNKTSGYTSWLCKQVGVTARPFEEARQKGIKEKRRKYERTPFDGTDEDKAYLLGLRHGDLSVSRPWRGVIRVSTSTTHPALAELFKDLFSPHGHIYQLPRYKQDTQSYEWNLNTILDTSFGFLLSDIRECWTWVSRTEALLVSYVAGVLDAEGSVGIFRNMEGTALQFIVYNTNLELVQFLKKVLTELGFKPLGPYLDKRKGTITSKYKIERKKDYWKVVLARFGEVQSLLRRLPIRHREKVARKQIALSLTLGERWENVKPRVKNLRVSIAAERDGFVQEAEAKYAERHVRAKGLLIESTQGNMPHEK